MLRCADDSYYVGHTDDLAIRLAPHQSDGPRCYTTTRRPVTLVWSQEFSKREEALSAERQIKGWSRRKKEALIAETGRQFSVMHGAPTIPDPSTCADKPSHRCFDTSARMVQGWGCRADSCFDTSARTGTYFRRLGETTRGAIVLFGLRYRLRAPERARTAGWPEGRAPGVARVRANRSNCESEARRFRATRSA